MAKYEESEHNKISADILSLQRGLEHFSGLKAIRIVSKTYNLLIMDDYLPIIGEIDGDLFLISAEEVVKELKGVTGFYKHSNNNFEFVLKGKKIAESTT